MGTKKEKSEMLFTQFPMGKNVYTLSRNNQCLVKKRKRFLWWLQQWNCGAESVDCWHRDHWTSLTCHTDLLRTCTSQTVVQRVRASFLVPHGVPFPKSIKDLCKNKLKSLAQVKSFAAISVQLGSVQFSSVQFSSLTRRVVGGSWQMMQLIILTACLW